MLDLELNQKLLFVTGKGGTGKSFIASILGVLKANEGKKVLLIDAEATGSLTSMFEHNDVGYEPLEVLNNLYISQARTDEALSEYLKLYAKVPTWAKITPLARLIDLIAHAAPGVREILVTGKICYEVKKIIDGESDYDVVIVDAPSSGHIISLIDAPNALSEMVSRGMIDTQTQWMQEILVDSSVTGVLITTLPDEVVMSETLELANNIHASTAVSIAGIVMNKDTDYKGSIISEFLPSADDVIKKSYSLFTDNIERSKRAKSIVSTEMSEDLFSFPFVADPIPSVRTLMKNAQALKKINKVSPTNS